MSVTAYVLIQTEVGRAEKVAKASRDDHRRRRRRQRRRSLRRDREGRGALARRPRQARRVGDPEGRRHHPHLHLPDRQPVTTVVARRATRPRPPRSWRAPASSVPSRVYAAGPRGGAAGVAGERELDEAVDELRVRDAGHLPEPRVHRDGREAGDGVHLVHQEARGRGSSRNRSTRAIASQRHASNARDRQRLRVARLLVA